MLLGVSTCPVTCWLSSSPTSAQKCQRARGGLGEALHAALAVVQVHARAGVRPVVGDLLPVLTADQAERVRVAPARQHAPAHLQRTTEIEVYCIHMIEQQDPLPSRARGRRVLFCLVLFCPPHRSDVV